MNVRAFVDSVMSHQTEECMSALVEAIGETDISEDDAETVFYLLTQVCEIIGIERPDELQDL